MYRILKDLSAELVVTESHTFKNDDYWREDMKATTVYKKGLIFIYSVVLFLAFALGSWAIVTTRASASAEEISVQAEGDERILYYIDAGYLVQGDTLASRGGWASIYDKPTPFMKLYGLEFGDGIGNGLYNSVTDKHLYELGSGDLYNLNNILKDDKTGKYWGTYVTDGKAYGWEWWRRGKTSSTKPGFESARYIHENKDDPAALYYDFEVDDTETELKVIIGTRRVSDGNQASTTNGSLKINDLATQTGIKCDDTDRVYTYDTGITGVNKNITVNGSEVSKPFVTVEIGGNGNITHVAYIIVCTKNYQLPVAYTNGDAFIKKNTTSVQATPSDGSSVLEAQITEAGQEAINNAEYFTEVSYDVEFDSDYGHKSYTWKATVLPADYDYFVNCGGSAIGNFAVADQKYGTGKTYGYKDIQHKSGKGAEGSAQYASDAYYLSCRCDTTSITYQFNNLTSGNAYAVTVGVVEHWTQYMASKIRTHTVSSNGESMTVACADSDNVMTYGTLYTVIDGTSLDVKIECPDESVLTFILIYEAALVRFDTQGGSAVTSMGFAPGKTTEIYADDPVKADYEFLGWFSAAEGGDEVTEVSESTTLYAHWQACVYDWTNAEWGWNGVVAAGITTHCTNCNKSKTANAEITDEITTPATCDANGVATYTATVTVGDDTVTSTKTGTIKALGHSYGTPTDGDWSNELDDNDAAYLNIHCTRDGCAHPDAKLEAEITSRHESGSCTEAGHYVFTATVDYDGNHYEKEYTRDGEPMGHLFGKPMLNDLTWNEDNTVTVILYCSRENCDYSEEVDATVTYTTTATCTEAGKIVYRATVVVNGIEYRFDSEEEDQDAPGHNGVKVDAVAATCTESGQIEYYECSGCGKKYSDANCTKEVTEIVTAPLGHNHDASGLVWNWLGYGKASVETKCTRCGEKVTVEAEITETVIKEATATADGEKKYTAKVTVGGEEYTDSKTETLTRTKVPTPGEDDIESGCNGSVVGSSLAAALILFMAAAVLLGKKQLKNKNK